MSVSLNTEITAACHCKSNTFTSTVPTSSLPLKTHLCHCNSCRHCLGALYATSVPWPSPLPENHSLQRYQFSEALAILFCGKCSQKMFWAYDGKTAVTVFAACLPRDKGLVQFESHIFVGDTKDGGLSEWLISPHTETAPQSMPIPRWTARADESDMLPLDRSARTGLKSEDELTGGDILPIRCHCGGINLTISRPDYGNDDKQQVPWYVDPVSRRKWLSVVCFCDSCRSTHSADLVPLTFVDMKSVHSSASAFPSNVTALSEAVARGDASIGTMARYQSSAEAFRFHCSRCSASIFYACDDRPELLDLATGLLDSPDGARAEGMLWWKESGQLRGGNWFDDLVGGWREEVGINLELERHHWREARGWKVAPHALQDFEAEKSKD